jgi:DNA-directed RNA polymerase specialized sigma24 family protein
MTEAESQRTARFDQLFHAYVADIAAYCRWRTRSASDADDALSEVFLAACAGSTMCPRADRTHESGCTRRRDA